MKKFSLQQKLKDILYLQNFKANPDKYKFLKVSGHIGVDVNFGDGDSIRSGFDGTIVYAYFDSVVLLTYPDKDGNCLEVIYSHGKDQKVKQGDKVKAGDILCYQDSTGPTVWVDEGWSHLHLSIRKARLTMGKVIKSYRWNFQSFSPINYEIQEYDEEIEHFQDPNNYCEKVVYLVAKAIEKFENMKKSFNNPGALRYSPFEDGNKNGFSVFRNYEQGFNALIYQLSLAITGKSKYYKPEMSILEFCQTYAPASDNNNPLNYARFIVNEVGLNDITDKICDWKLTELEWAKKYNNAEFIIFNQPINSSIPQDLQKATASMNLICYWFKKLWSIIKRDKRSDNS